MAVYTDLAGVYIIESLEKADYGCLPAPRRSHDADALASIDFEVEATKDGEFRTGWVGESDVLEFDGDVVIFVIGVWLDTGGAVDGRFLGAEM